MTFTVDDLKRVAWTAVQAFLAAFLAIASGWSVLPNLATAKAAGVAALVAGMAALISALKNLVTPTGSAYK